MQTIGKCELPICLSVRVAAIRASFRKLKKKKKKQSMTTINISQSINKMHTLSSLLH